MTYFSTKTFGNERGLSCAFRQWKAKSHCSQIHGYALGFEFTFCSKELDETNWVYDFGNTKWIKAFLDYHFDHTLIVAADDPALELLLKIQDLKAANVIVLPQVGCEAFASYVFSFVSEELEERTGGRVQLYKVKAFEHAANSAGVIDENVLS